MEPDRQAIARIEPIIRPYIRETPVVGVSGADFGLDARCLNFKLELLQHAGSFKVRGAFANLLTRKVPAAGVAAASGGNHGAAVAYAAKVLGKPARIFVPRVSSPAKIERIRGYGADLVVQGERYADALAAAEEWAAASGALKIHAFDEPEAILGQGTLGLEWQRQAPALDTLLVAVGGGGLIGGIAGCGAHAPRRPESRSPGRRACRRHSRRFACAATGRRAYVSARAEVRRARRAGGRRRHPRRAGGAMGGTACGGQAGRRGHPSGLAYASLPACGRRARGNPRLRRQHYRGGL
jgi:hypothetical protein